MSKKLVLVVSLLASTGCSASAIDMNPDRTIEVIGFIDGEIVDKAQALVDLAEKSKEDVYLLINSPGGQVAPGDLFIDAMRIVKERGVKVKCVTTVMAMSMAYNIYANCSERYATPNALLLYHPARVAGLMSLTGKDARELSDELKELDTDLLTFLEGVMGMDADRLEATFRAEKLWKASKLAQECRRGFINIVTQVKGPHLYTLGSEE